MGWGGRGFFLVVCGRGGTGAEAIPAACCCCLWWLGAPGQCKALCAERAGLCASRGHAGQEQPAAVVCAVLQLSQKRPSCRVSTRDAEPARPEGRQSAAEARLVAAWCASSSPVFRLHHRTSCGHFPRPPQPTHSLRQRVAQSYNPHLAGPHTATEAAMLARHAAAGPLHRSAHGAAATSSARPTLPARQRDVLRRSQSGR